MGRCDAGGKRLYHEQSAGQSRQAESARHDERSFVAGARSRRKYRCGRFIPRLKHIVSVKLGGIAAKLIPDERNDTSAIVFAPGSGSIAEFM